jgi:mono/diheme cytochrome c family protein
MLRKTFLAAFLIFTAPAHAAGDMDAGRQLVETSCSSCHLVGSTGSGSDVAPSFARIAKAKKGDPSWTRAWLMDPHPPMKGINLTRQQIDDVVAYLRSLSTD